MITLQCLWNHSLSIVSKFPENVKYHNIIVLVLGYFVSFSPSLIIVLCINNNICVSLQRSSFLIIQGVGQTWCYTNYFIIKWYVSICICLITYELIYILRKKKTPENCAVTEQVYSRDSCLTANTQSKFTCISTSETWHKPQHS